MRQRRDQTTNRVVLWFQLVQWIAAIVLVAVCSPRHPVATIALGAALGALTTLFVTWRPTSLIVRQLTACTQAVWSALFVSISGGQFETHFHVFVSVAVLAFYCDWRVLVTATVAVGLSLYKLDHLEVRQFVWQLSWLFLEVGVLAFGCHRSARDLEDAATREATLQQTATTVQRKVENRTRALQEGAERYRALVENTEAIPFEYDTTGHRVLYMAPQAARMFDCSEHELMGPGFFSTLLHPEDSARVLATIQEFLDGNRGTSEPMDYRLVTKKDRLIHARTFFGSHAGNRIRGITLDVTHQTLLEAELRQAQKLESVGRLAAGVAHEINTPIQFVGDNLAFTKDAVASLFTLVETQHAALHEFAPELARRADEAMEQADLPFLKDQLPAAIESALEGVKRVAVIVRSMRAFSHPNQKLMVGYDLREAIESTLAIALGEYKYVADVKLELEAIPPVWCCAGEINQAILNVVVNAAHAIAEVVAVTAKRGTLTVSLHRDSTHAIISIGDTGRGIPDHVRERVFEQFFTTKPVGKGTGQGLALTHAVIVENHSGSISFDTRVDVGTTFHLRIPFTEPVAAAA